MRLIEDAHFYDAEIAALQKKIANLTDPSSTTAFYGSSSFRLWIRMVEDLAPLRLVNLGFGGSSFLWCMHHFETLFGDFQPQQLVLYVGDNDLGQGTPKEEVMERFHQLMAMIWRRFPGIFVHYVSVKPSPARDYLIPTIKWVNAAIYEFAEGHENMSYINIFDGMLHQGHHPNTSYYLSDLLHLNKRGYVVWKDVFRAHFQLDES